MDTAEPTAEETTVSSRALPYTRLFLIVMLGLTTLAGAVYTYVVFTLPEVPIGPALLIAVSVLLGGFFGFSEWLLLKAFQRRTVDYPNLGKAFGVFFAAFAASYFAGQPWAILSGVAFAGLFFGIVALGTFAICQNRLES